MCRYLTDEISRKKLTKRAVVLTTARFFLFPDSKSKKTINNENVSINDEGFYGNFGGAYIPEILYQCVEQLKDNYRKVLDSDDFRQEFHSLLRDYVAVLPPLYLPNASRNATDAAFI